MVAAVQLIARQRMAAEMSELHPAIVSNTHKASTPSNVASAPVVIVPACVTTRPVLFFATMNGTPSIPKSSNNAVLARIAAFHSFVPVSIVIPPVPARTDASCSSIRDAAEGDANSAAPCLVLLPLGRMMATGIHTNRMLFNALDTRHRAARSTTGVKYRVGHSRGVD